MEKIVTSWLVVFAIVHGISMYAMDEQRRSDQRSARVVPVDVESGHDAESGVLPQPRYVYVPEVGIVHVYSEANISRITSDDSHSWAMPLFVCAQCMCLSTKNMCLSIGDGCSRARRCCCDDGQFCCQKPLDCLCDYAYTHSLGSHYKDSALDCVAATMWFPIAFSSACLFSNYSIGGVLMPYQICCGGEDFADEYLRRAARFTTCGAAAITALFVLWQCGVIKEE